MAQTITRGDRDVNTAQDAVIPQQVIQNKLAVMASSKAPFTLVTRTAKKMKPVGSWKYDIFEQLLLKRKTLLTEQVLVGGSTWNVTAGTGAYIGGWEILWNRTRNTYVHVKSRSTDAITVAVNIDGGTDTQGEEGDEVWILSNATQEAGGLTLSLSVQESKRTNYVQDIVTTLTFSDFSELSDYFFKGDGSDVDFHKHQRIIDHHRSWEGQLLNGGLGALITSHSSYDNPDENSNAMGITEGWHGFMESRADAAHKHLQTDLTEAEFITIAQNAWFGEDEGLIDENPMLWVPPTFMGGVALWNIGRNRFTPHTSKGAERVGFKYMKWEFPFSKTGEVDVIVSEDLQSTVSGGLHDMYFVRRSSLGWTPYGRGKKTLDTHIVELPPDQANPKSKAWYVRTAGGSFFTLANKNVRVRFATTS